MENRDEALSVEGVVKDEAISAVGDYIPHWVPGAARSFLQGAAKKETTKLAHAQRRLLLTVDSLPATSFFNLITFGNDIRVWKSELVIASSKNKIASKALISDLSSIGGSSSGKALKLAFSMKKADEIFFITDGQPNDDTSEEIMQLLEKLNKNKKVIINTIGLGRDQDEEFLKKLAEKHNGQYVNQSLILF